MTEHRRVAALSFTVTVPANHPALFCLGGVAFAAAASDLVDRTRKAAARALIDDPETRDLMDRYTAALSTPWGPGALVQELQARGVTEFSGTDHGDAGKSMPALLRECADEIDRETEKQGSSNPGGQRVARIGLDGPAGAQAKRTRKAATAAKLQSQPMLKLPVKGGNTRAPGVSDPPDLQADTPELARSRRKARS